MKKRYLKVLLFCGLIALFASVSFAQKVKPKNKRVIRGVIFSKDFEAPKTSGKTNTTVGNKRVKRIKKSRKRCRYHYYKRKNKTYRIYRCGNVKN